MITRSTPDGKQIIIGLQKSEVDHMLATPDECAHVVHPTLGEITIFVVDGDEKAVEEEFLRIVAISAVPDKGAKPQ